MQVECTNNPCGCSYNGRTIDIGATFNKDECNTCTCMSNAQVCSSILEIQHIFLAKECFSPTVYPVYLQVESYSRSQSYQNILMDMNQSRSTIFKCFFSFLLFNCCHLFSLSVPTTQYHVTVSIRVKLYPLAQKSKNSVIHASANLMASWSVARTPAAVSIKE